MSIAIVDYKAGNLTSVRLALESLGVVGTITSSPKEILAAERVIFPGVGAAAATMRNLRELGVDDALGEIVRRQRPLLGICVGMQALFEKSEEDGGTPMLGFVPGRVIKFRPTDPRVKVPQIGWNDVRPVREHSVCEAGDYYFVHSYYPAPTDESDVLARTEYAGVDFASMIEHGSLLATQFHPEKSGTLGLRLLERFLGWRP